MHNKVITIGINSCLQLITNEEVCMSTEAKVTTDHEEIKQWVEERGGHPARVKGTEKGDGGGLLRIDYPGFSGEDTLEAITWDEFFEAFDNNDLAFLYQLLIRNEELRSDRGRHLSAPDNIQRKFPPPLRKSPSQ